MTDNILPQNQPDNLPFDEETTLLYEILNQLNSLIFNVDKYIIDYPSQHSVRTTVIKQQLLFAQLHLDDVWLARNNEKVSSYVRLIKENLRKENK